ncbi:hypothetical protein CN03_05530 [Thalassolituus oleivorans]|uniref:hypothetical protein n=1 Tax=Thalassolituus oleivorans TaxID=187493 RepID=UPI0009493E97|nr:hypothetical protein [Thalassolituus oleivorans]APR66446.1 hypothetical protein CN03_05530 [Thalassolituus oleivorans]
MADFELEDNLGNRYRIRRGAGPKFWHPENLAKGSTFLADQLLCKVPVRVVDAAHNHFYTDVLTSMPNRQSSPQGALSDALAYATPYTNSLKITLKPNTRLKSPTSQVAPRLK